MEHSVPIALVMGASVSFLAVFRKANSTLALANTPTPGAYEDQLIFRMACDKNTVASGIGCNSRKCSIVTWAHSVLRR